MTVCVAALAQWQYGPEDPGHAIVLVTDRMMTSGHTEYEPPKLKIASLGKTALVAVSGDFTVHSQVLASATLRIRAEGLTRISDMAEAYAACLREFKAQQAAAIYLSPLGLNLETFRIQQNQMNEQLVFSIYKELQQYQVSADAIITGLDDYGHIYIVDQEGLVSCHDEIGFAAIGIGINHALSQFMVSQYASWWSTNNALIVAYAAKRTAESAPGVGVSTDIRIINRDGYYPPPNEYVKCLQKNYDKFMLTRKRFIANTSNELVKIWERQRNSTLPSLTSDHDAHHATGDLPSNEIEADGDQQNVIAAQQASR